MITDVWIDDRVRFSAVHVSAALPPEGMRAIWGWPDVRIVAFHRPEWLARPDIVTGTPTIKFEETT